MIAGSDLIEAVAVVTDHAGEDIEAARGALGIGLPAHKGGQGELFGDRDQVRAVGREHRALSSQVQLVDNEVLDLSLDPLVAGQETAAESVGVVPEAQVEACGLDVARRDFLAGADPPVVDRRRQEVVRKDAWRGVAEVSQVQRCRHRQPMVVRRGRPVTVNGLAFGRGHSEQRPWQGGEPEAPQPGVAGCGPYSPCGTDRAAPG